MLFKGLGNDNNMFLVSVKTEEFMMSVDMTMHIGWIQWFRD